MILEQTILGYDRITGLRYKKRVVELHRIEDGKNESENMLRERGRHGSSVSRWPDPEGPPSTPLATSPRLVA